MAYFSGEFECKLDAKGRMVLPSRLKNALPEANGNNIIITRGFEPCLVVYPQVEWNKVFSKVAGMNEFTPEFRSFQRNFFRGNTEVELDNNGRFLVPKTMLKFAQLEKDVVIVGMGNRMEVWNPDLYNQYLITDPNEFSKLAEKYLGENGEALR